MSSNINNVAASVGLKKLPIPALRHLAPFLSYSEQGRLAQVCTVAMNAARATEQNFVESTALIRGEIALLTQGCPITDVLLVALATSRAIGHPRHWVPHMAAVMNRLIPDDQVKTIIEGHAKLANALEASATPISSAQIYKFCGYLGRNQLSRISPWIGYRVLELYLLKLQLSSDGINKALTEYLTQTAKEVRARNTTCGLPGRWLKFQEVDIDPRDWFGFRGEDSSLWVKPGAQNGETAPMPKPICEVLWARIQTLQAACTDRPFQVAIESRSEAPVPRNFTLPLAQLITNAGIILDDRIIDRNAPLARPEFARAIHWYSEAEREELAKKYPAAVIPRD